MKYKLKKCRLKIARQNDICHPDGWMWVTGYAVDVPGFPVRFAVREVERDGWRAFDWCSGFSVGPINVSRGECIEWMFVEIPRKVASGEYARALKAIQHKRTIGVRL